MLVETRPPADPTAGPIKVYRTDPPRVSGGRRLRRIALLAALLSLVPALASYVSAMAAPSNSSLGVRTVEWLRNNGARGIVNQVENLYYSLTAPSKGGPGLKSLPNLPGQTARLGHKLAAHYEPPRIKPVMHPALPGEGVWRATFAHGGAEPPVLITSFRPDPNYPRVVAGVAWIDHTRTSTWLYPGIQEPAVPMADRGPEMVPTDQRRKLVATFNSAFKLADSGGGFADGGHTYTPLHNGMATFVRYTNGQVNIVDWNGGPTAGPTVAYARQNLPLIISGGKLNPNLSGGPEWGATLGNAVLVWRSGVGIDRYGNLIYAAANDQTVIGLARILQRAGAVRAMELDINDYWPSFITYRFPGAGAPANLLPDMVRSPDRYLTPDDRDFFAVYVR